MSARNEKINTEWHVRFATVSFKPLSDIFSFSRLNLQFDWWLLYKREMQIHAKCQNFTISGLKTNEIVLTVPLKINVNWLCHSLDQGLIKYYVTNYSDNIMLFHFVSDNKIIDTGCPNKHGFYN